MLLLNIGLFGVNCTMTNLSNTGILLHCQEVTLILSDSGSICFPHFGWFDITWTWLQALEEGGQPLQKFLFIDDVEALRLSHWTWQIYQADEYFVASQSWSLLPDLGYRRALVGAATYYEKKMLQVGLKRYEVASV